MTLPTSEAVRERSSVRPEEATRPRRPPPLPKSSAPQVIVSTDDAGATPAQRRWESLYGMLCSFGVHLILLTALGLLAFESSDRQVGSLVGILGTDGDVPADFILDSTIGNEEGGSDEPAEVEAPAVVLNDMGSSAASAKLSGGSGIGAGAGDGEGDGIGVAVPSINVPGYAVTKGSFSVWTDPEDPEPRQDYRIIIQIRLPQNLIKDGKYRASDITGQVIGTDKYSKKIQFRPSEFFDVKDGVAQLEVPIPGARKLVRDTIRIQSKLLKEKQTIQLEF